METIKMILPKKKSIAFNKKIYLLGQDKEKISYWLEEPKWNCGWYWGFGYVTTYTNNLCPNRAKDINSHEFIESFLGKQEIYNFEKNCWQNSDYIHNLIDSPRFIVTTFNEQESWQLTELFKQFYLLKDMAEFCHKELPGCHITISPIDHGNLRDWYNKINQIMIPAITTKIIEILTPNTHV